ncbi:uncharacterized protein LOC18012459 isoform X2 [Eutrema salsugineum]|uniref:uncharacterized protein LOC18012459 isoform X2 n=1 Tax=Eutrema salsugineum TaxID=72664 RepID=UPI000CED387C|nr:uncharacterized protein LOC18012459 isoform X2 [Eutrema salsugineum]
MTIVNKKRVRISSPASDSDDEDEGNPKTHENGIIGGKRRMIGYNKAGDTENRLKSNTCYVCDGNDDWLLVCHGEECPIAIHQSCTSDEPDFDEFRNFYCPYCCYKRVIAKSVNLREKLLVIEKSRKGRETLGGIDLGSMMDEVSENIENVVEVNVSGSRRVTSVDLSGNRRESDESYEKFMAMEKEQRMKEVAAETQSRESSETGDDDDVEEGRLQRGRFSESNEETSEMCITYAGEERKERARGCEKINEEVRMQNSGVDDETKKQRRCDVNHETAQPRSFVAGVDTRKQRIYSEKSQQNKRLAGTDEKDVFINDEETQARNSDMGEGTGRQGCCHENNQQKNASATESCEQEVRRPDKRLSHGSGFGNMRFRQGKHIEKNQHNETETQEKEVFKDGKRKREGTVVRDGDEFDLAENQYNQLQDNVNDSNAASQELALIIHPGVQERPIEAQPFRSAAPKKPSFQHEKYGHKSYLEKNGSASDDPRHRKFVSCSDKKRKRLFWTQAEEEMLRVGVQNFPGFRNIPWRKILEFGRDVFHDDRVPSDLKDKWKNMNKMSFQTGKWVTLSTERQPNHLVSEACSE